jgi:hypothetical protein
MYKYPKVMLHLGVHKTATTHTQSRLWNSRGMLRSIGVNYIGLNKVRERLTSKLRDDEADADQLFNALYPFLNCERLIVSDENIIGGTEQPTSKKYYPAAQARVKRILQALDGFEVEVLVTLRNYSDYAISRYSEFLRHFSFLTFEEYYKKAPLDKLSWVDLVTDLRAAGAKRIYVTDFSTIFNNEMAFVEKLAGQEVELNPADGGAGIRRTKISQEGYEVVKYYAEHYSSDSAKKVVNLLDNNEQKTEVTKFNPVSETLVEALEKKYQSDLSVISSMSGVEFF